MAIQVIQQKSCDAHDLIGEMVFDDVETVVTDIAGSGPHEYELCGTCRSTLLAPLQKLQDERGRPPQFTTPTKRTYTRRKQTRIDAANRVCLFRYSDGTMCNKRYEDRKKLRDHARKTHNATLSEIEGPSADVYTPFHCPECLKTGRRVATGQMQGLAMHRWRRHQVPMKQTVKEYAELSKKVSASRRSGELYYPPDYPFNINTAETKTLADPPEPSGEDDNDDPPPQLNDAERRKLEQALSGGAEAVPQQATGTEGPRPKTYDPWQHD
jgi:hypothetical protein